MVPLLLLLCPMAAAVEPVLDWTFSVAGFSAGAETTIMAGVRQPLWDRPGSQLLDDTYLQAQGVLMVTPAFSRTGLELSFQPAAVFELRLGYQVVGYYGTFSAILPYQDPEAPYDADARQGRDRTSGWGNRVSAQPTIRAKAGPVIVLGWTTARWEDVHPARFDADLDYWYEPELGLMVERSDWTLDNNALVLLDPALDGPTLYAGVYGTARMSLGADDRSVRVGPAVVVMTPDEHWTFYGIVQAYIESRTYGQAYPPFMAARVQYSL